MNSKIGKFITSVINFSENYKWTYGRQCRVGDSKKIIIKLPILLDENKKPVIDNVNKFNKNGYVPDFEFMDNFITELESNTWNQMESIVKSLPYSN
jgi:hypothetical protein